MPSYRQKFSDKRFWRAAGLLLPVVFYPVASTLHAQDSQGNTLDTLEVAAEITPVGEVVHEEFSGSYRRIEQSQLARRDVTLADILAHETGVQSRQAGGFGTFSSITVRAATAAQTGVYLDGIQLNSGGNAVVDLSLLDLLNAGSVDIYRGTTPVQFGAGAIGGAVNIKSLSGNSKETRLLLGTGSFNTQRAQLLHSTRIGEIELTGAFSLQQTDNDYPFVNDNATPLNPADDRRQRRNNAAAEQLSSLIKAGLSWSDSLRTDVLLQTTSRDLGVPEIFNLDDNQSSFDTDSVRLQLAQTWDPRGDWSSKHTLFQHTNQDVFDDSLSQVGLGAQLLSIDNRTQGLTSYWEHLGDTATTSFHLEVRNERQSNRDSLDQRFDSIVRRRVFNLTAQRVFYLRDDRYLFIPALRYQSSSDSYQRITRVDRDNRSTDKLTPTLGFRFDAHEQLGIRANIGRYFREPSFDELFGSRGLFQGNNNLLAEEGINADVGFSWQPNPVLLLDMSLFGSWRDELIATVFDARGIGRALNIGRARIFGVELGSRWQLNPLLSLVTNLTYQDARALRNFDAFDGRQLPGEAQLVTSLRLQYKTPAIRVFAEANGSRDRFYDQANVLPAEDFFIQNVGVDWSYGNWSLAATLNNITDQNVEDFNGLPRPGRSFTFSLKTTL